jgi:hypothetical protein
MGSMGWIDIISGYGEMAGFCGCRNEPSGSIKYW